MNVADRSNQYFPRGTGARLMFLTVLLLPGCRDAFCPRPPRLLLPSRHMHQPSATGRGRIKLHQLGSGDYLSNLSANGDEDVQPTDGSKSSPTDRGRSPLANVRSALDGASSEVGRRTSGITSGISNVAGGAIVGVERVAKMGTREFRRSTIRAQKAVKQTTSGLSNAGRGLADVHFFQEVDFAPKIDADEIVRWIDAQAKSGTEMAKTGTRWIDSQAKSGTAKVGSTAKTLVLNFTGKKEYQFGDVTKELVHRVASSEINAQDVILLLKILLALGATLGPLAELLPFTFLIEALNISLEAKVGGKVIEVLSKALDNRLVAAIFTPDDKNLIGDVVKRTVLGGVMEFTGKSNYESGDIQRAVQRGQAEDDTENMKLDLEISAEFEEWDRMFVEKIETEDYVGSQAKAMDMKIAMALEEAEAISQGKNGASS